MNQKTYSYCLKCSAINKISIDKIQDKSPICGTCNAPLSIKSLVTDVDLKGILKMIPKIDLPIVIDFWAPWCGPCKSFAPTFESASKIFGGKVVFLKINTQDFPQASSQFNIRGIPTLLVFNKGLEVGRESGAFPLEHLKNWLNQFIQPNMQQNKQA